MKNLTLTSYESPQVEVVEIEIEKGFAVSDTESGAIPDGYTPDVNNNNWLN